MHWMATWALLSAAGHALEHQPRTELVIQSAGDFYGARFNTQLTITSTQFQPHGDPYQVLNQNSHQVADIERWIHAGRDRFQFDDYGVVQLVVSSIDGLDLSIRPSSATQRQYASLSVAIEQGHWTQDDRILAIGGVLRALDYNVALFKVDQHYVLGLGTQDPGLNVESIRQTWTYGNGTSRTPTVLEWVLWDGYGRIGAVDALANDFSLDDVQQINVRVRMGSILRPSPDKINRANFQKELLQKFPLQGCKAMQVFVATLKGMF